VFNVNGLGSQPDSVKYDHLRRFLLTHDICVLLETRADDEGIRRFLGHNQQFAVFHNPSCRPGLPGQGVAILLRRCLADKFQMHAISTPQDAVHTVWLQAQGCVFGVAGTVMVGAVYVPPTTRHRSPAQVVQSFQILQQQILSITQHADHFIICGDYNASVARVPEPFPDTSVVHNRLPHLTQPRNAHTSAACTPAGHCLLNMVAAIDGILL
jgi:exonuclease III